MIDHALALAIVVASSGVIGVVLGRFLAARAREVVIEQEPEVVFEPFVPRDLDAVLAPYEPAA